MSLELVEVSSPQINVAGAAFYFHPDTLARGKALGLDGFRFYFLGRGGVLGDVEATVIASAFGYFHQDVVGKIWDSAREKLAPRDAATEYLECAAALGRKSLAEIDGLDAFNEAAETVTSAVDVSSLALFAGVIGHPLPEDTAGRAYRNLVALRELRGSMHLLAIVASGLAPSVAHAIRRPNDVAAFGWGDGPEVVDSDRASLAKADRLTDELMVPMFDVLSADQAEALRFGAQRMFDVFEDANRFQNRTDR